MFFALSFMVLVASFNILSSLVMLVRAKTRDIAIMRTMGATRRSLVKIFITTGTTIGARSEQLAGLALGFIVLLYFRESEIVDGLSRFLTGAADLGPGSSRFLSIAPRLAQILGRLSGISRARAWDPELPVATLYPCAQSSRTPIPCRCCAMSDVAEEAKPIAQLERLKRSFEQGGEAD